MVFIIRKQTFSNYDMAYIIVPHIKMETPQGKLTKSITSCYTNEDELYKMVIMDYIQNYYTTGDEIDGDTNIIDEDIQAISDDVIDLMFKFGFGDLIDKNGFADTNEHKIINSIDESFGAFIEHTVKDWLDFMPNLRPIDVLHTALNESLKMGFISAAICDNPDDEELYCDTEVMLDYLVRSYSEYGHPINVGALKKIVRCCMRILFHVGYSYGLKYHGSNRKASYEPCLFSEEEMRGGIRTDFFELYEDAYLEAIRIVCKLDDVSYMALSHEVDQQYMFAEKYWIRMLPGYAMSYIEFDALREIIGIRHGYNNNFYSFQKPHVSVPASFEKAKKRFEDELPKGEYRNVEWITWF